jgi:hypothetical protein
MKSRYMNRTFEFLKVFNSPFKAPRIAWYFGPIAIGTPYFFPRRWVKGTPELIDKAVKDHIAREERYNELNPKYARTIKTYEEIYESKKKYNFAVPKKIGFDFVSLGWKTKWRSDDYRFEWSPVWSFVFFKWQIAATFVAHEADHFWECWLYYTYETDRKASTADRIEAARKGFPCKWTSTKDGVETKTCYWDLILKDKWL